MVYAYLPLYHGAGVGGSVNVTLYQGASMLLRKKFSASRFWKDCVEHNITVSPDWITLVACISNALLN